MREFFSRSRDDRIVGGMRERRPAANRRLPPPKTWMTTATIDLVIGGKKARDNGINGDENGALSVVQW
jgi:hypothetical protein